MKRVFAFAMITAALSFTACSDDDDNGSTTVPPGDTTAPQITFADGRDTFRPEMGETRSATASHMHFRFRVTDQSALEEVQASVSGQYIGEVPGPYQLLDITDVYSAESPGSPFHFPSGSTELNVDSDDTDLWWDGNQARPNITGPLIAGPYDFSVWARDVFGNETSGDEMVMKRFYIARLYAPSVEVVNLVDGELLGEENEPLVVEGTIGAGEGNLAGELAFIWVRLVPEDAHDDFAPAEAAISERVWGTSTRISSVPAGQPLPPGDIDLATALSNENAIVLPDGHGHYDLIVWAEDVHGNVTRTALEVHVD